LRALTSSAPHPSTPYNPAIANVFFRSGEIETWGRGIERIITACKDAGTPKPYITFDGTGIALEFRYTPDYLKTLNAPESATLQVTAPVTAPVGDYVAKLLYLLGQREPLGNEEVRIAFSLRSRRRLRETYIDSALNADLIERTLPDKPNSRLQKYRLTPKGRAWLCTFCTRRRGP